VNATHINKLFMFIGVVTIIIAANTWLSSQGGKAIFSIALIEEERPAMAFMGLILVGFLLCIVAGLGWLYSHRFGTKWHERVPPTWLEGFESGALESQVYQVIIILIFVVFPLGALIHFTDVFTSSKLCVLGEEAEPVLVSSVLWHGIPGATNQVRLVEDLSPVADARGVTHNRCEKGIQVFPPVEFLAVFLIDCLAGVLSICFVVSLFRGDFGKRPN
jgi:hypothetical protein